MEKVNCTGLMDVFIGEVFGKINSMAMVFQNPLAPTALLMKAAGRMAR